VGGADLDYIAELFSQFGPVTVRRMFSGAGIFADGLMIALVVDGVIFLKADAEIVPRFEGEGLPPFSYKTKEGRRTLMSYWRMPERLYDDPDELAGWARRSMAAARRSAEKPRGKPVKRTAGARRKRR
jgi:DNA transformation protein